jgi:1-aminocyclopropane-1-carboxylate deaminase/D-cysteine desulfhydrase-like pyridoxal-dependent ACC family enzyme
VLAEPFDNLSNSITSSPLQKLSSPFLDKANVQLYVKRDDLIHPQFGGNKWRKLKYNLIEAKKNHFDTLLTFGGAWSNHIYATAAAGKHFGFSTIGIIRGEQHSPLNATLSFASDCGMQLHYINRKKYREKNTAEFLNDIKQEFGNVYIIPEGGSNTLALKGCSEIIPEIYNELCQPFDVICCASGTGATLAGLIAGIEENTNQAKPVDSKVVEPAVIEPAVIAPEVIGMSVLKGGNFLNDNIIQLLRTNQFRQTKSAHVNWRIETDYHFGGYAKISDELVAFMQAFESEYNIQLDAVYTAKMFYGLFKLIENKCFKRDAIIIAIHSGGLQGNKGFNL